jgi:septal ring factor EnvC (AmiA/AmiB activator)
MIDTYAFDTRDFKLIEKPNIQKIQNYIDYCEEQVIELQTKLNEYDKDIEIQSLKNEINELQKNRNSLCFMTDKEKENIERFKSQHQDICNAKYNDFLYQFYATGFSTGIQIICPYCNKKEDVSDMSAW